MEAPTILQFTSVSAVERLLQARAEIEGKIQLIMSYEASIHGLDGDTSISFALDFVENKPVIRVVRTVAKEGIKLGVPEAV